MKTARNTALAAVLVASVFGSATCDGPAPVRFLVRADAQDLLYLMVEMANRSEEPGIYTYPCPLGGEVEVTVAIDEEQQDSIVRLSGRWEIDPDECQPGARPGGPPIHGGLTILDGHFAFTSKTVFDAETRRFEVAAEAEFSWRWSPGYDPSGRVFVCDRGWTDLSGVFEVGFDEPYTGSVDGLLCELPVETPVSSFPGGNWSF